MVNTLASYSRQHVIISIATKPMEVRTPDTSKKQEGENSNASTT